MEGTTKVVIEFLTTEKNCTLVSNEIDKRKVFMIAQREGIDIINREGKKFEQSTKMCKVHYIRYE